MNWIDGDPSDRRRKVLFALGLIPGLGLVAIALLLRDMRKLDERIARRPA